MIKKPSGYQIINLGKLDLSSPVTITTEESEIAKILYDSINNPKKPIILTVYDTDSEVTYSGMLSIFDTNASLTVVGDDSAELFGISVTASANQITVTRIYVSLSE